jgi:ATP-dependent RNA helicase RhlB
MTEMKVSKISLSKTIADDVSVDSTIDSTQVHAGDSPAETQADPTPSDTAEPQAVAEAQSDSAATQSQPNKPSSSRKGGRSRTTKAWSIDQFAVPELEGKVRFHDLELPTELMRAIADLGFEYCSSIQAEVLPHTLDGYDAVGKAQTGTGKTAAFLLAAMNELLINPVEGERFLAEPRVVVLAPMQWILPSIPICRCIRW